MFPPRGYWIVERAIGKNGLISFQGGVSPILTVLK
jgi:hypothetical protein